MPDVPPSHPPDRLLRFVRTGLPLSIAAAGLIYGATRGFDETGIEAVVVLIAAASSLWFLSILMRIGINSEGDRDREVEAREYFDRHGRWPDEAPPPRAAPADEPPRAPRVDPHRPSPRSRR